MHAIDPTLIDRARPHLLSAMATFGSPGDDPYRIAQVIAQEAKMAGFSKIGRRRLLEHLYVLLNDLLSGRMDPFRLAKPAANPQSLFTLEMLAGLFDTLPAPASAPQVDMFFENPAEAQERALIEQLIAATRLYTSTAAVHELVNFAIRLRAFAPFNAMLLHIQKPGLTYAATAADWHQRFGRVPKSGTRPLLVLRVMGPVDFVFDILDTEGREVPEHAFAFPTLGALSEVRFTEITTCVSKGGIDLVELDAGDGRAGWIRRLGKPPEPKGRQRYELAFNRNHPAPTRVVTVAHELAHLYLGHLGADKARDIRDRRDRMHAQREVEAEMAAWLVAKRNGLTPRSESYLSSYSGAMSDIDLYAVMRVANAVEMAMGISSHQLKANGLMGQSK
jgi:hypothetical protein